MNFVEDLRLFLYLKILRNFMYFKEKDESSSKILIDFPKNNVLFENLDISMNNNLDVSHNVNIGKNANHNYSFDVDKGIINFQEKGEMNRHQILIDFYRL